MFEDGFSSMLADLQASRKEVSCYFSNAAKKLSKVYHLNAEEAVALRKACYLIGTVTELDYIGKIDRELFVTHSTSHDNK